MPTRNPSAKRTLRNRRMNARLLQPLKGRVVRASD
jgi:hypothetical protein